MDLFNLTKSKAKGLSKYNMANPQSSMFKNL